MQIILGSRSPRRKEILEFFSLPFSQLTSHFAEELVPFEGDPVAYATKLSEGKAASLAPHHPKATILTADTIVFREGKVYGKPADEEEALETLKELSQGWHSVFTAVTGLRGESVTTVCEETRVLFHPLSEREIRRYHEIFQGHDMAGGYGIQMGGSVIVKRMEGCFYNVMGLPIGALRTVLLERGIDLWDYLRP